jgi:hypothetical protein
MYSQVVSINVCFNSVETLNFGAASLEQFDDVIIGQPVPP